MCWLVPQAPLCKDTSFDPIGAQSDIRTELKQTPRIKLRMPPVSAFHFHSISPPANLSWCALGICGKQEAFCFFGARFPGGDEGPCTPNPDHFLLGGRRSREGASHSDRLRCTRPEGPGICNRLAWHGVAFLRQIAHLKALVAVRADVDMPWAASSFTSSARGGCTKLRCMWATELRMGLWHALVSRSSNQSSSL